MGTILEINSRIGDIVWGWPMLILLVGTGIVLTFRLKFIQIREFVYIIKSTLFKMFSKSSDGHGEVTAFQAVATALAATVGTGNIAGVALAIAIGGPGAIFWMWLSAFFGMATKFSEVVLAIVYREKNKDGSISGGPMYYIKNGIKMPWLAKFFAMFGMLATLGTGNMTQSNAVASVLDQTFGINKLFVGCVLAILAGIVIIGGIKRIGVVTEKLVPFMAAFYIIGAIVIIAKNIGAVPGAFALIFGSAFSTQAMKGGFAGASVKLMMKMGISRGVFTNEAGLGTAPIAHAAATTDHPVRQGMWGIFEVLMDTLVICTMTALVIIVTGQWNSGLQGAVLTTTAFETGFKGGSFVVAFGLTFFAFSTILGWAYYGERCMEFLFGKKSVIFYRIVFIPAIVVGSIGGLQAVWAISDTLNGLMAIPNLIAIFMLQGVVVSMVKDFFADPDYVRESHHEYISALPITEEDKKAVGNLIMK